MRTPSGISYVLENREIMMRLFPEPSSGRASRRSTTTPRATGEFARGGAVGRRGPGGRAADAGAAQQRLFRAHVPRRADGHRAGRGGDLFVHDDFVWMRTTEGPVGSTSSIAASTTTAWTRSPSPDCLLGVPGLLSVYRNGGVTLANAIGTGVADDKSIYPYVPDMIVSTWASSRSSRTCPPTAARCEGPHVRARAPPSWSSRRRRARAATAC